MENYQDALDNKVKKALQNLEVPYEPSSWARMEARLMDAPTSIPLDEATEQDLLSEVDTAVRPTLKNFQASFQSAHWEQMAKRLQTIKTLTRRIYSAKISEAAIILLALLNWGNLLVERPALPKSPVFDPNVPVASAPVPVQSNTNQIAAIELGESQNTATTNSGDNNIFSAKQANEQQLASRTASTSPRSIVQNNKNKIARIAEMQATALVIDNQSGEKSNSLETISILANTKVESTIQSLAVETKGKQDSEQSIANVSAETIDLNVEENEKRPSIAALLALPNSELDILQNQIDDHNAKAKVDKIKRKIQRYVATYASAEGNKINTPYDPISRNLAYSQTETGVGAGVLYGKKRGKWAIETGLAYSSIRYNPRPKISGQHLKLALNSVNFETVSIPVRAVRTLGKSKQLSIKAFVGANVSLIAEADYGYKTYGTTSGQGPNEPPIFDRENGKGLLEGGNFADNSFINVETGLRFEHSINSTNRWKLFIEPHYKSDILNKNGTGPNRDRLSAFSLRGGVLTVL